MDVSSEIIFKTTRSGGAGGQNVNKVETAVIAYFNIAVSAILTDEQKTTCILKLSNKINTSGALIVKAQEYRTQLENKGLATAKINQLIRQALIKKKARIATKASKASIEKRIQAKKQRSDIKSMRRKDW